MYLRLLGGRQRLDKGGVFVALHRAVDIIRLTAIIARCEPRPRHVDGIKAHQRRRRVEKAQIVRAAEVAVNGLAHGVAGQRAGRNDDRRLRDLRDLALCDGDIRVAPDLLRDHARKAVAVDCQRAARLDAVCLRALQDQASQPPQLLLQQADRILQPVAAQGIRAHQLGKIRAVVRGRHFLRLHLHERHMDAALRKLPRRLASGQTRADHLDFLHVCSFL